MFVNVRRQKGEKEQNFSAIIKKVFIFIPENYVEILRISFVYCLKTA